MIQNIKDWYNNLKDENSKSWKLDKRIIKKVGKEFVEVVIAGVLFLISDFIMNNVCSYVPTEIKIILIPVLKTIGKAIRKLGENFSKKTKNI